MQPVRVLVVDDHYVVRKGIRMIAGTEPAIDIVGEASNGHGAIKLVHSLQPDVVLLDLIMPHYGGLEALAAIKESHPAIKVVILTTFEDDDSIYAAMNHGADGYLLKDADGETLLQSILEAYHGDMPLHPRIARHLVHKLTDPAGTTTSSLTDREKEVLQLVAQGLSNKEVAKTLNLSTGTVKIHVSNVLGKLNVTSRTEAAVMATQMGLVSNCLPHQPYVN
jgi:DNA-binding NarL/FixJ family response regulator